MDESGWCLARDTHINPKFVDQFLQREGHQPVENIFVGGSQGHAGGLRPVSRGESFVMIHPAVVVTRGSKVDQARKVARDAGKRTMLKVVIGTTQSHEFGRVAHGVPGFSDDATLLAAAASGSV